MAMVEGEVTINPVTGAVSGAGFARTIFDDYDAKIDYQGLTGAPYARARQQIADVSNSAATIVPYIVANAEVATTVTATAADVTAGVATADVDGSGAGTIT